MRSYYFSLLMLVLSFSLTTKGVAITDCERSFVSVPTKIESRLQYSHVRVEDRAIYFEHLPAARGKPTLFLLNGMFVPSMDLKDLRDAFEQKSQGEGLLIMYYSTQLESLYLRGLLEGDPALNLKLRDGRALTRADLASEAAGVLKASGAKGEIYPTGFSFGSGPVVELASLLTRPEAPGIVLKELVFLSPFVHSGELLPFGTTNLESLMRLNPFFGATAIQKMREQSARSTAVDSIDDYIKKVGNLPEGVTREIAIQGVTSQIMSVMDFDLRGVSSLSAPVHFVLAQNENPLRLVAQKDAFQSVKKSSDRDVKLTLVPGVSHNLLAYEPAAGADALLSVLRAP